VSAPHATYKLDVRSTVPTVHDQRGHCGGRLGAIAKERCKTVRRSTRCAVTDTSVCPVA
jgi:hypothetical protein